MTTINDANFRKIDQIIAEIKDGTRLHEQSSTNTQLFDNRGNSCGSAHCICGWFIKDYIEDNNLNVEYETATYRDIKHHSINLNLKFAQVEIDNFDVIYEHYTKDLGRDELLEFEELYSENYHCTEIDEWAFTAAVLGLKPDEAYSIFGGVLELETIEENFEEIKKNHYMIYAH